MPDIKRCSNCHYWEPTRIGIKDGNFSVLYCWCFKHNKYTDAVEGCEAHSVTQIITGEGK